MTSGLPLSEWSKRNSVIDELTLVALSLRWDRVGWAAGNFVYALAAPESREIILSWAQEQFAAQILDQLGHALASDPSPLQTYPTPILVSPGSHFNGKLSDCFVSAAVCIAFPRKVTPDTSWRLVLVLWLLVHAIQRTTTGNVTDRNLREIARALYNFQDVTSNQGALLKKLAENLHPQSTFATVNLSIQARAGRRLAMLPKREGSPEKKLLQALIAASQFANAQDITAIVPAFKVPALKAANPTPLSLLAFDDLDLDSSGPGDREIADAKPNLIQWDDEEPGIVEIEVSPWVSEDEQRYLGKSILLLSAEQRQLLPWTWATPNRLEAQALDSWIDHHLESDDDRMATLASLVLIARRCGRSLSQVLEMQVKEGVEDDWCLSLKSGFLRRIPPMRPSGWKPKSDLHRSWIRSLLAYQVISLPQVVVTRMRVRLTGTRGAKLIRLWRAVAGEDDCEEFFLKIMASILPRLRPSMLANMLRQDEFERTADESFARLLASSPQTGLPASCAYGNWQVSNLPATFLAPGDTVAADIIALGSRLDPIEALLVKSISSARAKIESRRSGDSIDFHNASVAMLVIQLLAATGARPVLDPVEAATHFNLKRKFVYLDDKASGDLRQGRLVPLPQELVGTIFGEYRRHLAMVAGLVSEAHPAMAAEITNLSQGERSRLPLFFFLELRQGCPHWISVSQASIERLDIFDWPLPLNLFRHRLAQRLRRLALNPEIVDGLMGHAEAHGATYGDQSFRVWKDDMEIARPLLQKSYDSLGFASISSWAVPPAPLPTTGQNCEPVGRSYGIEARANARRKLQITAFRSAEVTIRGFLGDRALTDLDDEEIYKLSKLLLLNESGQPSLSGNLRYDYLLLRIRHQEKKLRQRVKLRRRFFWKNSESSPFTPTAVLAEEAVNELRSQIDKLAGRQSSSKDVTDGGFHDRLLAVVQFALHHHIANPRLLKDLICGTNIRFVRAGGILDLEYGQLDDASDDPHVPVQRFPIPPELFRPLIAARRTRLDDSVLARPLPNVSRVLGDALSKHGESVKPSIGGFLEAISNVIDQWNAMNRPGVAAGVLAGRVATFSPTWPDFMLYRGGVRRRFIDEPTDGEDRPNELQALPFLNRGSSIPSSPADDQREMQDYSRQLSAKEFARDVRRTLDGILPAAAKSKDIPHDTSKKLARKQMGPTIRRLIRHYRGKVSSAVLLLGEWTRYLLGDKAGMRDISGIHRYLDALFPRFCGMAYDADLLNMDRDGITELYKKIMESCRVKHKNYVGNRLVQFHRWAESSYYGLPPPDWSEVPDFPARDSVLPGLISEQEYLAAQRLLWHASDITDETRRATALLMIGGYRFGLREEEAWGLLRSDWLVSERLTLVLVRHNHLRGLKGRSISRRQVPLLIALNAFEQKIISHCQATSTALHGDRMNVGFVAGRDGEIPDLAATVALVNRVLKQVTGNRRHTHHHLRHSYINRIIAAILGSLTDWQRALGWDGDDGERIRLLLLGETTCARRLGWAIARLLGHMGPTTTFKNYIHLLLDWALMSPNREAEVGDVKLAGVTDLDGLAIYGAPSTLLLDSKPAVQIQMDFQTALKFLRLLSRGWACEEARKELGADPEIATKLFAAVNEIGSRLRLKETRDDDRSSTSAVDYLGRITESAWGRLLALKPRQVDVGSLSGGLATFSQMVGATKQILMWESEHIVMVRGILKGLGVDQSCYQIAASNKASDTLVAYAQRHGLSVTSLKALLARNREKHLQRLSTRANVIALDSAKRARKRPPEKARYNAIQLDVARVGPNRRWEEPSRLALLFKETQGKSPANSLEFLIATLALLSNLETCK